MRRTLALLWGVVACSNSADTVESLAPNAAELAFSRKPFESISLTPATASIAAGATQQFTTTGLRSNGTTATVMPTWSVNGGTISSSGLYTAGATAGTYRVVATSGNLADTSMVTVTVTTTTRSLTSLALTPVLVSLAAGATQQFAVAATWSDGSVTAPAVVWSSSGGSVSSGGLYTAGGSGGTFRVIASSGARADTSSVTITLPISSPPASTEFVNAPAAGWTTVASLTWSQPVPYRRDPIYDADNGTHLVDWGDDDPYKDWGRQAVIVPDASTPGSIASSLELRLPAGLTGGYGATKIGNHPNWTGNGPLWWSPSMNTGYLYVGMWVKFAPGYTLNGNVAQKIFYLKSDRASNARLNHMVGVMVNDGNGGNQLWPTYEPQNPYNRYKVPETTANNLNDGRWHQLEFLQLPNSPGVANGTLRIWIDGRLEGSWTNAMFFDATQVASVNRLEINPIYGGGTRAVPVSQWIRLGPVLVKTR